MQGDNFWSDFHGVDAPKNVENQLCNHANPRKMNVAEMSENGQKTRIIQILSDKKRGNPYFFSKFVAQIGVSATCGSNRMPYNAHQVNHSVSLFQNEEALVRSGLAGLFSYF